MFFTREDILKIQNALLKLSIKDSELPNAEPVTYDDTLSIIQDGKNKQIKIEDFFNQISLWKREDFINITDKYDEHYIILSEAIKLVPILQRKDGLVITFQDTGGDWVIYQFRGNITEFFEKDKWFNLYDYRNYIVQSIVPDEEDLTASIPDENGNSLVHLKDRVYDPTSFSGKGYKILRKNIQSVNIASTKITITEVPSSDGTLSFTINGKETQIDVSASTDNTTALVAQKVVIALQESMTEYDVSIDASLITLTRKSSGLVTPSVFSVGTTGVVCTVTDNTKREFKNILMPDMINQANTIYVIRYDFNLGEDITIPNNCVLEFDGGSLSNGIIVYNNTTIIGEPSFNNIVHSNIENINNNIIDITMFNTLDSKIHIKNKEIHAYKNTPISINCRVILENCKIKSNGKLQFIGNGSVDGIINGDIDYNIFGVHINLISSEDRNSEIDTGDIYVDSILGDDRNSGDSALYPLKSIVEAINKASNGDTIILRSGNYELSETLVINKNNLTIQANSGENPIITGKLEYFNSQLAKGRKITHNLGKAFLSLYDTKGNEVPIAESCDDVLERSSFVRAINVSPHYFDVGIKERLYNMIKDYSTKELNNGYIVLWRSFSTNWSRILGLNKDTINNRFLLRYWCIDATKDQYGSNTNYPTPFYLANLPAFLTDTTFCSTTDYLYLPTRKGVYFTSKEIGDNLIDFTNTTGTTLVGIKFMYIDNKDINLNWFQEDGGFTPVRGILYGLNAKDVEISKCEFKYNLMNCIYTNSNGSNGSYIHDNKFENLKAGTIHAYGNQVSIVRNKIKDVGLLLRACGGIISAGQNVDISYNVIDGFANYGIMTGDNYASPYDVAIRTLCPFSVECHHNIVKHKGYYSTGEKSEKRMLSDGSGIDCNGNVKWYTDDTEQTRIVEKYNLHDNIIYNINGFGYYETVGGTLVIGIYGDQRAYNCIIKNNLIFNVLGYSLYWNDPESGVCTNNTFDGNILGAPVHMKFSPNTNNYFTMQNIVKDAHFAENQDVLVNVALSSGQQDYAMRYYQMTFHTDNNYAYIPFRRCKRYTQTNPDTNKFLYSHIINEEREAIVPENLHKAAVKGLQIATPSIFSGFLEGYYDATGFVHVNGNINVLSDQTNGNKTLTLTEKFSCRGTYVCSAIFEQNGVFSNAILKVDNFDNKLRIRLTTWGAGVNNAPLFGAGTLYIEDIKFKPTALLYQAYDLITE